MTLPIARCTLPLVTPPQKVLSTHPGTTEATCPRNGARITIARLDDKLRVAP